MRAERSPFSNARPHMAQAGGRDPDKLDEALAAVPAIVQQLVGG